MFYNFKDKYSDSYLTQKEELIEEKLKEENIEPTGFPGHDETFLKINEDKTKNHHKTMPLYKKEPPFTVKEPQKTLELFL